MRTLHKFSSAGNPEWEKNVDIFGSILWGRSVLVEEDGGYRIVASGAKYLGAAVPPHLFVYKTNDVGKIY